MKLKKLITMGIAAIMAVSAMSVNVFAEESSDKAVLSILGPDGVNMVHLTQEDIDNGKTTLIGYQGLKVDIEEKENVENDATTFASYAFNLGNTSVPTSTLSVYNTTVNGIYTLTAGTKRFSSKLFLNETNSKLLMDVNPNAAYNGDVTFTIAEKEDGPLVQLSPINKNTYAITATIYENNSKLYIYAENDLSSTINGTMNVTGYN